MRKVKLYITASLDGFIAPPDGDMDWLVGYPLPSKEDHENFTDSVDTVIIGGRVYHDMQCMDILWPYKDKTVYVVARNPRMEREEVKFITENIVETVTQLKKESGKDIWLVSGGWLTSLLNDNGLIDEIIITKIPETLEKGIQLPINLEDWILKEDISYDNAATKKVYQSA
ncbi:MAG: Riboflavin biosynthesis protein RibD domain-containing protein [Bacteroidetes bacterium 38_7]|jgi:dihydrofolate reductase|nr:MAG: Riboflavin biosynthesis protein RibD domain-containing protein [Bacteroidetes bacterium 38_7]